MNLFSCTIRVIQKRIIIFATKCKICIFGVGALLKRGNSDDVTFATTSFSYKSYHGVRVGKGYKGLPSTLGGGAVTSLPSKKTLYRLRTPGTSGF